MPWCARHQTALPVCTTVCIPVCTGPFPSPLTQLFPLLQLEGELRGRRRGPCGGAAEPDRPVREHVDCFTRGQYVQLRCGCGCWIALHADSQPLVHTALAFALTPVLLSPSQMVAKSSATVRKQTPAQVGPRRPQTLTSTPPPSPRHVRREQLAGERHALLLDSRRLHLTLARLHRVVPQDGG